MKSLKTKVIINNMAVLAMAAAAGKLLATDQRIVVEGKGK